MVRYETLILAVPEITNEEASKFESQFTKMVKEAKGNVSSFDRWGKYKLAYPVKKNEYGVYFLTRFEIPSQQKDTFFKELKDLFKIKYNELIMRNLTSVLAPGKSLDYTKPRSLEETPQDIDSFLQKNKMQGMMGDDNASRLGADNEDEEGYSEHQ